MSTHLFFTDAHAHYEHRNDRAIWLGELIHELRPDVVIDGGDTADMPSLSGYDKGTRAAVGRTYHKDIEAHNDFQDKLWQRSRHSKKKLPRRVRLIGNHEQRIDRALDAAPTLEGTVSYKDLLLDQYYDTVIHYNGNTPGVIDIDGVLYSHYFTSGNMGRPVGGEHSAYTLLAKKHRSCTQGHSHILNLHPGKDASGKELWGLIGPAFMDYKCDWAGQPQEQWHHGVIIKRNVEKGHYSPQYVSIEELKKKYG